MSDNKLSDKITATPEQIAAFDELLAAMTPAEQHAVQRSWKAAQAIGYRTGSKRVFALNVTTFVLETVPTEDTAAA